MAGRSEVNSRVASSQRDVISPFAEVTMLLRRRRVFIGVLLATAVLSISSSTAGPGPYVGENDVQISGPETGSIDQRYAKPRSATASTFSIAAMTPAQYGEWSTLSYPTTVRAIHVTLLRTGQVLLMAGSGNLASNLAAGSFTAETWDPISHTLEQVPPPWDMFCAGHVVDPQGNVLVMGGTTKYSTNGDGLYFGSNKNYSFNIETRIWERRASMFKGRWYPTAILDPTGQKVLVFSGKDEIGQNARVPEVYDLLANQWTQLPAKTFPLYPGMLWTAKGKIFFSGAATGMTQQSAGLWSPYTGLYRRVTGGVAITTRSAAATVFAGDVQNQLAWLVGGGFPATNSTILTDLKSTDPVSVSGPSLPTAKAYVLAVNLSDLRVLETGGGTARKTPVYEASVFYPDDRSLRPVAPPTIGRTYHSSAILLSDGSVATFGGDFISTFELRIEIYKPDYFFKGPRPIITGAPTEVSYGGAYPVSAVVTNAVLTKAVLIRPASTTHSTDANQRSILLGFSPTSNGGTITLPLNRNIAPPGWYMLFLNDSRGRPSVASWIHLT
jgi:hypothetical protein